MGNLQKKPKHLMTDAERVQDFQRKLYRKAKQDKAFRFYVLYDKVRLSHILRESYKRCKAKGGSAGVDGVTFEEIEEAGVGEYLTGIQKELEDKTYKPQPVKRVMIPKANGKYRPLGIPVIKDRIVQMAVKTVIEPIFEADFENCSHGFRPKRCAADAIKQIKQNLKEGKCSVYDADLSAYFDTIPHKELMHLVAQRISDRNVLHLIKMWLKAPVMEDGRPRGGKGNKRGTPQGGVISPLLANIYLHLVDKAVKRVGGVFQKAGVEIVRYADDFVLMASEIPKNCIEHLRHILGRMGLEINTDKSKMVNSHEESFNFLGFTFRYSRDLKGRAGRYYWNVEPSTMSQKKIRDNIRKFLARAGHYGPEDVTSGLNSRTMGWVNYFSIQGVSYPAKANRRLRYYLRDKLMRYYARKSQRRCKLYNQGAFEVLRDKYGLVDPTRYTPKKATVKA